MPDADFALPGRRYPIAGPPGSSLERDKWQAKQAIRYLQMGRVRSKSDYLKIRNAIIRRYGAAFWTGCGAPTWETVAVAKRRRSRVRQRRRAAAN
jgi:hypothetical protein